MPAFRAKDHRNHAEFHTQSWKMGVASATATLISSRVGRNSRIRYESAIRFHGKRGNLAFQFPPDTDVSCIRKQRFRSTIMKNSKLQ